MMAIIMQILKSSLTSCTSALIVPHTTHQHNDNDYQNMKGTKVHTLSQHMVINFNAYTMRMGVHQTFYP